MTTINTDIENLVVNTGVLQLVDIQAPGIQPYHPPVICAPPESDSHCYDLSIQCIAELARYLEYNENGLSSNKLSKPMQRKLVTLIECTLSEVEWRGQAYRAARSLGERAVTELLLHHQDQQHHGANLWAAVRARGCQFLGPALQEEALKLVFLALEDGSALSRKVLVMFVVQRLKPHYLQISKTPIGHVVQLLYRASCFKLSKRDGDSSLMQLKEQYRTYGALRKVHDAQIVHIATEVGLRISSDQWSALLYGDMAHKSHMQSIIDESQTPQSFAQSVQDLVIALQRTGDPARLSALSPHLELLAAIDPSVDTGAPCWQELLGALEAVRVVVDGLVHFVLQHGTTNIDATYISHRSGYTKPTQLGISAPSTSQVSGGPGQQHSVASGSVVVPPVLPPKYKVAMCNDIVQRGACPRGDACTFAHNNEELNKYRPKYIKTSMQVTFPSSRPSTSYPSLTFHTATNKLQTKRFTMQPIM